MKPRKRDVSFPSRLRLVDVAFADTVSESSPSEPIVNQTLSAARYIGPKIADCSRETMVAVALDVRLRAIAAHIVSIGTLNSCPCNPRDVFAFAILTGAYGIVLGHNHPSSDCTPSEEDRRVTERIAECGRFLGIRLFDHLVIAGNQAHSIMGVEIVQWR